MRNSRHLLVVAIIAALLLSSVSATHPQGESCQYFAETSHYVCGEFLEYFKAWGGLEIFGYPLTEAFNDPTHGGLQVQYFQRARMEFHPRNSDPYRVQLGLLVDELDYNYPPARPAQIPPLNSTLHHYFPETQHVVSYAFLDYFRQKGGLNIFGYPRSEFMYENGHIVQYFQRARMEWHPERVDGPQMSLSNLGETYIERFGIPGDYDEPVPFPSRPGEGTPGESALGDRVPQHTVTELSVSASVRYAITGRQGTQTIFVYASDQKKEPIQGADVKAIIHYPSGDRLCGFTPTDANGFARCNFDILPSTPGKRVVIEVTVTYNDLTKTTQAFFLPWW